jgi:isoquinoline 1-oxidoreductase subunit beta
MVTIENLSRRTFLKGASGVGGLVLGIKLAPFARGFTATTAGDPAFAPNLFVSIDPSGTVTIVAHRSEMGQGVRTGLPMILADELEADWERVVVEQAVGDEKYGSQYTDGSRSVVHNYQRMREFGAAARQMLEQAAAQQWGVDPQECRARNHRIVRVAREQRSEGFVETETGESLDFGAVVAIAATLPVPEAPSLRLKDPADFRYVGKDVPIVDLDDMLHGRAQYTIDVALPGMKYASVERCPVVLGKVRSYEAKEALAVPGVEAVIEIPAPSKPLLFKALGGLAVVASNTWAAQQGRSRLQVEWDLGDNVSYDSGAYRKALEEVARAKGDVVREEGDVGAAFDAAATVVEAEYYSPHFVHAPMEPPGAVAHVHAGMCEAWSSTQDPQATQATVAEALGIDPAKVISRVPLLGGAFGRKSKPDFAFEAAVISQAIGAPVKVTWSREDDIRHGYYHSCCAQYLKAALDENGRPTAWLQRSVFPPIESLFTADAVKPASWEVDFGLTDLPYAIPNVCLEAGEAAAHVRIGWLRSVQNIFHAYATGSFVDELATQAGRDPVEYLLELIGEPRHVDLAAGGVKEYFNYDGTLEQYPIDTGRLANVVRLAAEKASWGRALPERSGMGIAAHRSFLTYVATVVEAAVSDDGKVSIPRVVMAVDAGTVINPDRVRAQMEGATIYGMSAACYGEITAKEGRIQQSNFDTYNVVRMSDAPRMIEVHLVASEAPPGGVGEPGTPPFAPALCNAIYAATGKRIRSLPIMNHDLSKA